MLSSLRPALGLRRTFLNPLRPLSTAGTSPDQTMVDALAAVGTTAYGDKNSMSDLATSSSQSKSSSQDPVLINIPPAEDPLLHYLTSKLMSHGHRQKASRLTARTLLRIHAMTRAPPLPILREAILAASPAVRCISQRRSTKKIMIPVALGEKQRVKWGVEWILEASKDRPAQHVDERLAKEIIAVVQGTSPALKKKEEMHRVAMVNRGNAKAR